MTNNPDSSAVVQSAVLLGTDRTVTKMRFVCASILVFIWGDLVFGDKPSELSVALSKAETSATDKIYYGQSLTVIMTIKFPAGNTSGVRIELIPSTSKTVFALGEIYNSTVGADLTKITNTDWFTDVVRYPGPEYKDSEVSVYYNTRAVFDLGDVINDGHSNDELESYIIITYQVVYVNIGTNSNRYKEYWISCGAAFNSDSYMWISHFSVTLETLDETFSGPIDTSVKGLSEIEDGGSEGIVDLTMKIGKAKPRVIMEALVLSETTDIVPMKIEMISAAKGFNYSFRTEKFLAKQSGECSFRNTTQQSLVLDFGTIVNKESQKAGAVEADNAIDMRVKFMVTNASALGKMYSLGIGILIDGVELYVANFKVPVVKRHTSPTAFDTFVLSAERSHTVDAGGVAVAMAVLIIPPSTFHTYIMKLSTNVKDGFTSKLSILSYSIGAKGDNIPCGIEDSVELIKTNTDVSNPTVMNEANMTFSILNTGLMDTNDYVIKITVMALSSAGSGEIYELNVNINGTEKTLEFTVGNHTAFDESVQYNFSSWLIAGPEVFTGTRFQLNMLVNTERNTFPGAMTIEIPITRTVPYVKLIQAQTTLKGANVICPPTGILEATTSSWNKSLNDSKRSVITVPAVCNHQLVDESNEDNWVITFDLQIDHPDLYRKPENVPWGIGVKFSGNQIFVTTISSKVIPPDDFGSVKVVTGLILTDSKPEQIRPGDYALQWSPDLVTFYDHHFEMVTTEQGGDSQVKLALRRPIVTQYLRHKTSVTDASRAITYSVDELDIENSLSFLGNETAVATMMPQFMFALDGDIDTCMDLPVKNATDTPPYLIGQIATKLLNMDGFKDNTDVTSTFKVDLLGQGLSCNTSKGPQRTLVWHPKEQINEAFHGNLTKCQMESETDSFPGSKTKCTYLCICDSVSTCEFILMAIIHDDYPSGPYNLCEMWLTG